jgi:murein DD-endopeptidase MepM/ murein hydrolase activator NlpD
VAFATAGVATPAAAQMAAGGGGAMYVAQPSVAKVACVQACASKQRARGGSTIAVRGRALSGVTTVVFLGGLGKGDEARVAVRPSSDAALRVKVPYGATSGSLQLLSGGASSKPSAFVAILPSPPPEPNPELSPVPGTAIETGTSRTKAYVGARRAVTFSYRLNESATTTVELVRATDGSVVKSWTPAPAAPGAITNLSWSGTLGKSAAPPGRYSFRLTAAAPNGVVARSSQGTGGERDAFDLYDNVFPIRGRHQYGTSAGRFGAGRGGHSHQGQDVFATCGTRLVAARGGKVQYAGYQGRAGNYLVIDGEGTGEDYAYMHLAQPSPFRTGDRVYTGQEIGLVGDTGVAYGCHLHFELWSAPGWYSGGQPHDPLSTLKTWDSWS